METPPANPDETETSEALLTRLEEVDKDVRSRAKNHAEAAQIYRDAGVTAGTADTLARYHFAE